MKKRFFSRLAAIGMCVVSGFSFCFSSGFDAENAKAVDTNHDDWLHVEGNKIVDMNGDEVWLTGCNWFGYNVGSQVFDGVWSQNMHSMLKQIADHGFNLLRVPMSTEILLQWKNGDPDPATPKVNTYSNPELSVDGTEGGEVMYSFDIWNMAVDWCKQYGIKIMMDIHSAETASAGHQIHLWYTDKFSTEDWMTALEWFADYYKDDDTIIALDLKNEPHGTADEPAIMAKWDDSTDPNNWAYAATECGKRVLDINPNLLIMIEGVEVYPKFEEGADWTSQNIDYSRYPYSYYHHTWWGGNFRGVRDYPIDFGNADYNDQIVYSPHDYGPLVFEQTWFYDGFTQETLLADCWYDNWAFINVEGIAPLLMGEWGGFIDEEHDPDGRNTAWMTYLRDYMIETRIHHTFWCFNENSGDTGGLVYDNFGVWDEDKYALVKPSLWQNEDGKFISLDHEVPVGANGISLGEYYGTSSGTTVPGQVTTTTTTTTAPAMIPGDLNKDKRVNLFDALEFKKYIIGHATLSIAAYPECDVNSDGAISVADLVALNKYLIGA